MHSSPHTQVNQVIVFRSLHSETGAWSDEEARKRRVFVERPAELQAKRMLLPVNGELSGKIRNHKYTECPCGRHGTRNSRSCGDE